MLRNSLQEMSNKISLINVIVPQAFINLEIKVMVTSERSTSLRGTTNILGIFSHWRALLTW